MKYLRVLGVLLLSFGLLVGCMDVSGFRETTEAILDRGIPETTSQEENHSSETTEAARAVTTLAATEVTTETPTTEAVTEEAVVLAPASFDYASIAPYSGAPSVTLDDNIPGFSEEDKTRTDAFEQYSKLDNLGRCGVAYANICPELMPTEPRGEIGQVRPSGWHTVKYNDVIEGNYLYNRCHLIGYQLAGENDNTRNLITGTRYLNVVGMLEYENRVADYVNRTGNHVLYRVTPRFEGENLVASGVEMEAWSVEDSGAGICFHVYCYNVQPGIEINYANGNSNLSPDAVLNTTETVTADAMTATPGQEAATQENGTGAETAAVGEEQVYTFVLNTNTKKFHLADCNSVTTMAEHNKYIYTGTIREVMDMGYKPCKRCLAGWE